jgi:hypothetical protein
VTDPELRQLDADQITMVAWEPASPLRRRTSARRKYNKSQANKAEVLRPVLRQELKGPVML